jgi:hypothetical protein
MAVWGGKLVEIGGKETYTQALSSEM